MVTLRVLACLATVGGVAFLAGFRAGSKDARSRQLAALVDELFCWDDPA